jgi:predicted Zn-dependent peptidase
MLKTTKLKNGLTIIKIPKPASGVFIIGFVVSSGSQIEDGYFPQGISHLVERLFWCGTDKHPSTRSLNLTLESIGGNFYSLTNQESTQFYLTVPFYNQYKATSMLSEILQRSYFGSQDVDSEKKFIIERLKQDIDNQSFEAQDSALSNLYQNSSIGFSVKGSVESVSAISHEAVLEYLSRQYQPSKSYLILGGNFDNKGLMELIEQEWGIWNPKNKKFIEPMPFQESEVGQLPRISYRQRASFKSDLVFSFLLDEGFEPNLLLESKKPENQIYDDKIIFENKLKDWATILLLNTILGRGLSSRLWLKTIDEEMLFETISSDIIRFKSTGCLQISGITDNTQFSFALESVLSVLEGLKKTTVSINELAKAKAYLKGKFIMEHENLLTEISWYVEQFVSSSLNFSIEELLERVEAVEAPEIRNLAGHLFVPQKLSITSVGTTKETRLIDKLIAKYLN